MNTPSGGGVATMNGEPAATSEEGGGRKEKRRDKKEKREKSSSSSKKDKRDKKEKRKRSASSSSDAVGPSKADKLARVGEEEEDVVTDAATVKGGGGVEEDPLSIERFRLCDTVKGMLREKGFETLFPIQAQTLELLLDGNDVLGRARTGSGKTLAFVLPIVERLRSDPLIQQQVYGRPPSVLVLAPTRELAKQVSADFEWIGKAANLVTTCIYGGTPMQPQERALHQGIDVLVGTPGRIKDHFEHGSLILGHLKYQILDECDQMLNMGFVDDVELLLNAVEDRSGVQTLLFSATTPNWINSIARKFLKPNFKRIDLVGESKMQAAKSVRHLMIACHYKERHGLIQDLVRCYSGGISGRTIVFAETKIDCDEVCGAIGRELGARAIHGDIPQQQREVTLAGFREGQFSVLVATDVAARGLDISGVELVIQCHPPKDSESYVHRSGRTGRAGKTGVSIVLVDRKHEGHISLIQRQTGVKFERIGAPQPEDMAKVAAENAAADLIRVEKDIIAMFRETAERVVSDFQTPVDALAAALACITGHTKVNRRSLLTATEGWTTLFINLKGARAPGYLFGPLRRILPENIIDSVKGASLCSDGSGIVFDVPSDNVDRYLKSDFKENGRILDVSPVTSLPELRTQEGSYSNGGGGRYFSMGRGRGSRGRGGGGRGFRGGGGGGGRRRW